MTNRKKKRSVWTVKKIQGTARPGAARCGAARLSRASAGGLPALELGHLFVKGGDPKLLQAPRHHRSVVPGGVAVLCHELVGDAARAARVAKGKQPQLVALMAQLSLEVGKDSLRHLEGGTKGRERRGETQRLHGPPCRGPALDARPSVRTLSAGADSVGMSSIATSSPLSRNVGPPLASSSAGGPGGGVIAVSAAAMASAALSLSASASSAAGGAVAKGSSATRPLTFCSCAPLPTAKAELEKGSSRSLSPPPMVDAVALRAWGFRGEATGEGKVVGARKKQTRIRTRATHS